MAVSKPINFHALLEAWVVKRDPEALQKLQPHIQRLARQYAGSCDLAGHLVNDFGFRVMTWFYERSESAYKRNVAKDSLSYAFASLSEKMREDASLVEDLQGQREIFCKIMMYTIKRYAYPEFISTLERMGELPKRLPKKNTSGGEQKTDGEKPGPSRKHFPPPVNVPLEDWHGNSDRKPPLDSYDEHGEPEESFKEIELVKASDPEEVGPDKRFALLKALLAKQTDVNRVTIRLRFYPVLEELTREDIDYILKRQRKLPESERLIDTKAEPRKLLPLIERMLNDPSVIKRKGEIEYSFIGSILDCTPATANSRVFRFIKDCRLIGVGTDAGDPSDED